MKRKLLATASILLLAGCVGRTSYGVEISDERPFTPGSLTVAPGTTVVFKNTSTTPQSVSADPGAKNAGPLVKVPDGAAVLASGVLYPGETYSYTFETPGTYVYVSRYPEDRYSALNASNNQQDNTPLGVITVTTNAAGSP